MLTLTIVNLSKALSTLFLLSSVLVSIKPVYGQLGERTYATKLAQSSPLPAPETVIPPRQKPLSVPDFLETEDSDSSFPIPQSPHIETPPEESFQEVPTYFKFNSINFIGNTIFPSEELTELISNILDSEKPFTVADLYAAATRITEYYREAGYITTGALPRISLNEAGRLTFIESGKVTFQIFEGSIEDIEVMGTQRLNEDYIRARLELATQPPLNRQRLVDALQLLHNDPLIDKVEAILDGGTQPGSNTLQINIQEARSFNTSIFLDNSRSPNVGDFQQGLQLSEGNFGGIGDRIITSYRHTEGSDSFDVSYALPLNPHGDTLTLSYSRTDSELITPSGSLLDIESTTSSIDLTWEKKLIHTPRQELSIGVIGSHRRSEVLFGESIFGFPVGFPTPGADTDGRSKVTALRFFQEWVSRNTSEVAAARSQFSLGLGNVLDSTINETAPDNRFFSWRGQAQYQRLLAPEMFLLVRADAQVTPGRSLLPIEQFGLGGQRSVRGYRQDLLLADNGLFTSAEVWLPVVRLPEVDGVLQVTPFVDLGWVWNSDGDALATDNLASVGLGLRWQQDNLIARLDWGLPLVDVARERRTWQEDGFHFSLSIIDF
ncbi:MAG: ShlB/FhaC/HecB family hemolysin secretion/activation protein [Cyanobacteria bacterium P01_D01_bin.156]